MNIKHLCSDHYVHHSTETLIVGTFNPAINNDADFFYGRPRNSMWNFLGNALGAEDLRKSDKRQKIEFLRAHRVDFVDLIVEIGQLPLRYDDRLLDRQNVIVWADITAIMDRLPHLKRVGFSRKTFRDIPVIGAKVDALKNYLLRRKLYFCCLHTPARAPRRAWPEWRDFLTGTESLSCGDK